MSTFILQVQVLRLHFLTPAGTFNLGVVSDKTSSTGKPAGSVNEEQADLDKVVDDIKNLFNRFTEAMSLGLIILLIVFGVFILVCIIRLIALLIKPILEALFAPLGLFKKKHKKRE